MRTFIFALVVVAATISTVLSQKPLTCQGTDTSTCTLSCPHTGDFLVCHDGECHCHHLAEGTCTGNDISGCTGDCGEESHLTCFNNECHCEDGHAHH